MIMTEEIGVATIIMADAGPETAINLSSLNELSSVYLAVKGFTAFMTGFERDDIGPGKIRGILQIPQSESFAVAFDHNMKGSGNEADIRLQHSTIGVICLIVSETDLELIRKYYLETESFLVNELQGVQRITELTESFIQRLKGKYNTFLRELVGNNGNGSNMDYIASLYDVTALLSLPKEENLTARAIMTYTNENPTKGGATIEDICSITKRRQRKEILHVRSLLMKGLIIIAPRENGENEIKFIAR